MPRSASDYFQGNSLMAREVDRRFGGLGRLQETLQRLKRQRLEKEFAGFSGTIEQFAKLKGLSPNDPFIKEVSGIQQQTKTQDIMNRLNEAKIIGLGQPKVPSITETLAQLKATPRASQEQLGIADKNLRAQSGMGLSTKDVTQFDPVSSTATLQQKLRATPEGQEELTTRGEGLDQVKQFIQPQTEVKPSTFAQLIAERDALPVGHPDRAAYERKIGGENNERINMMNALIRGELDPNDLTDIQRTFLGIPQEMLLDEKGIAFLSEIFAETLLMPAMGMGAANMRAVVYNAAARYAEKTGQDTGDIITGAADVKGLQSTIKKQRESRGAAGSFVRNINKQVTKLKKLGDDLFKRTGFRAYDLPRRMIRTKVQGSADEAIIDMFLTEISTEIGKLASNAQASIRELNVETRKRWESIHDPNLSLAEVEDILNASSDLANMRLDSIDEELDYSMELLRNATSKNKNAKKKSAASERGQMSSKPPASEHSGRVIEDTETGKKYRSDGINWVEM